MVIKLTKHNWINKKDIDHIAMEFTGLADGKGLELKVVFILKNDTKQSFNINLIPGLAILDIIGTLNINDLMGTKTFAELFIKCGYHDWLYDQLTLYLDKLAPESNLGTIKPLKHFLMDTMISDPKDDMFSVRDEVLKSNTMLLATLKKIKGERNGNNKCIR